MNILETKELCYSYQDNSLALDHLSLSFEKGKTTALLGGNGAGKSTLFLNLNGVLTPDSGQVLLDGTPIQYHKKGLIELRQRVGIVFQDPNDQLFSASVLKDISFGAVNLKLPPQEIRSRVEQAAEQTGITSLLHSPTHALSFGQKKRVAIAGVLVMRPEIIILDEPTAGLDPAGVSEVLSLLEQMKRQSGTTILIATHDIDLVPLHCDYAYLLDRGQKILEGSPAKLFEQKAKIREHRLRLPRIAHLTEILQKKDHLPIEDAATISQVRRGILHLLRK